VGGILRIDTGETVALDAGGCIVHGDGKLVALVGVQDLIVVDTADALLVCPKERSQEVKGVVEELVRRGLKRCL
jgi:mannose-1-phosphate guanylyltransferase